MLQLRDNGVRPWVYNLKVLNTVVRLDSIFVVYVLPSMEATAKMLHNNVTMLKHVLYVADSSCVPAVLV